MNASRDQYCHPQFFRIQPVLFKFHLIGHLIVFCADHMFRPPIGLALGGAWGFREGAGRPLAVSNARLRINSILNSVTRRGTFLGNSAGVLGMIHPINISFCFLLSAHSTALGYNGINSTIDAVRGKHDAFGSMVAGALTGALFKSTGECLLMCHLSIATQRLPFLQRA